MDEKEPKILDYNGIIGSLAQELGKRYWFPLYQYLKKKPELIKTFTGFLSNHETIVIHLGKQHIGIEYTGKERAEQLQETGTVHFIINDHTLGDKDFFDEVVGFKYDSTAGSFKLPLPPFSEDIILPSNKGFDKLIELKWNFDAQDSLLGFNSNGFMIPEGQFSRIINGLFFDADENGLKTRHIKWLDLIPITYDDSHEAHDLFSINLGYYNEKLIEHDAHYIYPLPDKYDFKYFKLPQLNRFIELTGTSGTSEPEITKFLETGENKFILTMGFLGKKVFGQIKCEWQSERRAPIIPDFFIERPDGYSDIVEFKLPDLKGNSIVGKSNRETFSAEINSYISQTRNYRTYFEDPNNRKWVEDNHTIKVHNPKRILVVGRRWNFSVDEWKEIVSDYRDLEIITYDDLIDGVVAQFYM